MAFRKKFRKFSRRRRGQPIARKRVTWFESYNNNLCSGPDEFTRCATENPEECCTSLASLTLVNNDTLEQQFSDRLRVIRLVGNLWINVNYAELFDQYAEVLFGHAAPFSVLEQTQSTALALSWLQTYLRVAISKVAVGRDGAGQQIWLGLNPLTPVTFSEGQWKWIWEHAWNPVQERNFQQTGPGFYTNPGCCPIITGEFSPPDILDGTTVPLTGTDLEIETDCQPCAGTPPGDGQFIAGVYGTKMPNWWKLSFDKKVSIPMRENERLLLQLGWKTFDGLFVLPPNFDAVLQVYGGIRSLLQY